MRYGDIRKRREAAKAPAPKQEGHNQKAAEVKRFEVGGVYNGYVCVGRWRDEKGVQVALVESDIHRMNVKLEHEIGIDFIGAEYYDREFDNADPHFVRTYKGVEYAIDESDLPCVDGDLSQIDAEDIETPNECAVASAAKMSRIEPLDVPCKNANQAKPRRRQKGNAIVGFLLIVILAALVKSCAA